MSEGKEVQDQNEKDQESLDERFAREDAEAKAKEESQEEAQSQEQEESEEKTEEVEESKEESTPNERPVYTMSVAKAQKEKAKALEKAQEDHKQAMEALKSEYESKIVEGKPTDDVELREFAKANNLDETAAIGLFEIFKKGIKTPDLSKYDELLKEQEIAALKSKVSINFDKDVLPLIKADFPKVTDSHINKIKTEIEQLAFTKQFNTYPVEHIYLANKSKFEFKDNYTAEDSGGRTKFKDDLGNLSEEEASKLSPEDYTKWMDIKANGQSRYYLE